MMTDLGTKVTILEALPKILPGCDERRHQGRAALVQEARHRRAHRRRRHRPRARATARAPPCSSARARRIEVDLVVMSVGRRPLLRRRSASTAPRWRSTTGASSRSTSYCRTAEHGVYAVGDVIATPAAGPRRLRRGHRRRSRTSSARTRSPVDYARVPWCIYCHPEVAFAGHSEESGQGGRPRRRRRRSTASCGNGRALIVGEPDGMVKIIAEKDADGTAGRILGVHMVGPWVTEQLGQGYLAVNWEATVDEVAQFIQPHPTLSELFGESVLALTGRGLHGVAAADGTEREPAMADIEMPQLGETVTEGTITKWFKAGRRPGRRGRGAVRGLDRQGRLRGAVAGRRLPRRDPGARGRDRRRRRRARRGRRRARPPAATAPAAAAAERRRRAGAAPPSPRRRAGPAAPAAPAPAARAGARRRAAPAPAPDPGAGAGRAAAAGERRRAARCRRSCAGSSSEHGLDVGHDHRAPGVGGRITRADVEQAIDAARRARPRRAAPRPAAPRARGRRPPPRAGHRQRPAPRSGTGDTVEPFNNIRRRTGEHMVRSKADVGPRRHRRSRSTTRTSSGSAARTRTRSRPRRASASPTCRSSPGPSSTPSSDFPHLNATVGDGELIVHNYVNLGIAVDLNFEGLLVPVIHDADDKRLRAIAREISDLAARARTKKLSADDIAGGTFTITNPGPFGTHHGAADHQPAAGRHPLHRRRDAEAGRRHRRRRQRGHRHPLRRHPRPRLGPPGLRRRLRRGVPARGQGDPRDRATGRPSSRDRRSLGAPWPDPARPLARRGAVPRRARAAARPVRQRRATTSCCCSSTRTSTRSASGPTSATCSSTPADGRRRAGAHRPRRRRHLPRARPARRLPDPHGARASGAGAWPTPSPTCARSSSCSSTRSPTSACPAPAGSHGYPGVWVDAGRRRAPQDRRHRRAPDPGPVDARLRPQRRPRPGLRSATSSRAASPTRR